MEISNEAYVALERYFNALSHIGYKSQEETEHLLIFLFIEEILTGPMSVFVTEQDYNAINNVLYCMYGSCTIPYPSYLRGMNEAYKKVNDRYRITESGILRSSYDLLRILS